IPAGHTLIVSATLDPQAGTVSCSDSKGNTYRTDVDVARGSGTDGVRTVVCSAAIRTALVAGNTVVLSHPSVMARAMNVAEFSGYLTPTLDRSASAGGDSGTVASGATAVTTQASELVIGTVGLETKHPDGYGSDATYTSLPYVVSDTVPNGTTKQVSLYTQYRITSTTGSFSTTGTIQPSRQWAAALATYKENCGNGLVDAGEQCDGGTCCTATCTFVASGTACRTGGGVCDVAEACTGASATCPADATRAAGTVCRAAAGVCHPAENCTGASTSCPADARSPQGTTCRAAAGPCDLAETCDGTSATCPTDAFAPATTECRAATGECDVAELCTGSG